MEQTSFWFTIAMCACGVALSILSALIVLTTKAAKEKKDLILKAEQEKDRFQKRLMEISNENSALRSRIQTHEEYEKRFDKELGGMKDAFKALSAQNSAEFRTQSAESISLLLKPIQEKFAEFGQAVRDSQKESAAQSAAMKENIENVMRHSKAVGDEARNLADALTGYSKVQGDFGEMLLTDVLKNAGLTEGIHFQTQGVMTDSAGHEIKTPDGRTMIPDVMVWYPDDTTVIIDSKVSLKAFKDYMISESIEGRKKFAKAHVESVRSHVDELKAKDYASYLPEGKRKVKYNIMFIPIEGAFRLMLEEDPRLWQVAKDNNVLIVSQMTLVIVLNMIQMAWKQASQEKNITEVYRTAEELMSQLGSWMDSYALIGKALEKASQSYCESTRKLRDSNQSVI